MKRFLVTGGIAAIGPGELVALDAEQARVRMHNLDPVAGQDGVYRAKVLQQFKVGEVIGLAELPKNLIGIVTPQGNPENEREQRAAKAVSPEQLAKAQNASQSQRRKRGERRAKAAASAREQAAKKDGK